jgi:hypothetical protein
MRHLLKHIGLLLVLIVAQHGAVVHELGHIAEVGTEAKGTSGLADSTCALCPAYAQVVSPAFSHSFHIPLLVRTALEPDVEPLYAVAGATPLAPRSRGPPSQA